MGIIGRYEEEQCTFGMNGTIASSLFVSYRRIEHPSRHVAYSMIVDKMEKRLRMRDAFGGMLIPAPTSLISFDFSSTVTLCPD